MREILDFFKDIFMINKEERINIGLSQFKVRQKELVKTAKVEQQKRKEPKLSDLMRGVN